MGFSYCHLLALLDMSACCETGSMSTTLCACAQTHSNINPKIGGMQTHWKSFKQAAINKVSSWEFFDVKPKGKVRQVARLKPLIRFEG